MIYSDLPSDEPHGWKYLTIGPDNKLYFQVGAPCNICMPPPTHAQIRRINMDGSGAEVIARGIRQIVGMDFHPTSKVLYFSENQRDWMSEDTPEDKLNRLLHPGKDFFGFPYCHSKDIPDPEFGAKRPCKDFVPPVLDLGPHVAALGMRFYTGSMFPPAYRNQIFIAQHGSWNRSKKIGYRVMHVQLDGERVLEYTAFAEGWLQGEKAWGRPVDVQVMPDGALLVSDDYAGAIYRISYQK